jgi:hypothetical protein
MTAVRSSWFSWLRGPAGLPARLGLIAFGLLWVLAVLLSARTYTVMADTRAAGDAVRARLMAQVLAQRFDRALSLGIPLAQLVGVPELLQQRLAAYPDVRAIAVQDPAGRTLWEGTARDSQLIKARLPLFALPEVAADAPIAGGAGTVRLVVRSPDLLEFMRSLVLPLTLGCAFFALLSWLAALAAFESARRLRDRAVRMAARDIAAARYDRLTTTLHRRGFDLRVQQLARAVRAAHETLVRARRVVSSLRRTEPHPARREWLDRLLAEAEGDGRFVVSVDAAPVLRRVVAADAEAGWSLLLLGSAAGAALTLCAALQANAAAGAFVVLPWAAASLAAVPGWLLARRSHVPAVLVVSMAGALLALAPWLQALGGWQGDLLVALCAGLALGAAGAAVAAMQRTARQRPDLLPLARRPWAARAGAAIGLLGLGPALAGLALMVGQDNGGWLPLAPMVPALLAVACAWRWNAARSPWRTRTRPGPMGARPSLARTGLTAFGGGLTAAGLLACATGGAQAAGADDLVGLVGAAMLAATGLLAGLSRPAAVQGARTARVAGIAGVLGLVVFIAGSVLALLAASGVFGGAAPAGPNVALAASRSMGEWWAAGLQFAAVPLLAWALGAALRDGGGARHALPASRAWAGALASAAGALVVGVLIAWQPRGVALLREFAPAADTPVVQARSNIRPGSLQETRQDIRQDIRQRAAPSEKASGDGT